MKLEGFFASSRAVRRIRWRAAKTEGPLRAVFKRAGEFFLRRALARTRRKKLLQEIVFCNTRIV